MANASHELRTPLALNRALVELAVTRPGAPEETRRLGESLLAVNERHERLIDGLAPAPANGDPVLLERLTFNLVENLLRHNLAADGWVEVRTALVDGRPTLRVTNTGPLIAGYDVETMFQPFRRLSRERVAGTRGFGLGLSIVRAVARAHGGTAEAHPRPGGGLVVTVTLPPA